MAGDRPALLNELAENGWALLEGLDFPDLLELCGTLGRRRRVTRLLARPAPDASGPSLSASHGLGVFPPHTDGATDSTPPAYVALWSAATSGAATLLYDGHDPALDVPVFSRTWLVDTGRRHFYVVPRTRLNDRIRWRFNPDCMRPADGQEAAAAVAQFQDVARTRVEWRPNAAVIFDNSRVVHGREGVDLSDGDRELMRISVTA